jgi:DNA processing protein
MLAQRLQPRAGMSHDLITISLFRSGFATIAARYAKFLFAQLPPSEWVDSVAAVVWADRAERQLQIARARESALAAESLAARSGHALLTVEDDDYPALLREIVDPPVVLWTQGDRALLSSPSVAVVGSREALPASLAVARMLARDLSRAGLTIVSGMARGVDSAAHMGALEAGGRTIAVVGSGLLQVYPRENESLAASIRATGTIVSELPPDAPPLPPHFPLRNRIISGLSLATVVVEAGEKSGSLITANQALDQGRDVFAVPGNTLSGRYIGGHRLIKEGARLVDTVEDVLEQMGWRVPAAVESIPRNHLQLSDLESNMARGESYSVDNLAESTHRSASDLLAELSVLELSGRVMRTSGGQFIRLARQNREGD